MPDHASSTRVDAVIILVAGEALVDMTPVADAQGDLAFRPRAGGSPLNVAVGLARLQCATGFLGSISTDPFGQTLQAHMVDSGVDLRYVKWRSALSTLAFVHPGMTDADEPQYTFYGENAADAQLWIEDLPDALPDEVAAVHTGSIAMDRAPIGEALAELMRREQPHRLISFDPNVRPDWLGDSATYRAKLDRWLARVDLVKTSGADLAWIAPEQSVDEIAARWLERGPKAVVVTLGAEGALGFTRDDRVQTSGRAVDVVDTVGAGDAFTSGLLARLAETGGLDREGPASIRATSLSDAMAFAAHVSAITCTRPGADPPTRAELTGSSL